MPFARYFCIFINVGLGEGSALPIGVPVPWPSATPPTGWLKCNGAPFSAEEYPELAKVYPTNELPDLRGEFIRGWDDGRGVDAERSILTAQEDMIKSHEHSVWRRGDNQIVSQSLNIDDPGRKYLSVVHSDSVIEGRDVDSLYAVPTGGSETRPRNIAFNYIVRAV
ncbi:phage tail protein [Salmonella enterica subsp. enterica serovar Derby]|nr:phage tail protein [Salmonella enterica subsp. enterica serovar Derby]